MKIGVALPAAPQPGQAGVRIRYLRLAEEIASLGHSIECVPIDDMARATGKGYDCYIVSKVYDARAVLLCESVRQRGKIVGIDLFDDYFSQRADTRLGRLRHWLEEMAPRINFVLCSTPRMAEISRAYAPGTPVHLLNDPAECIDPAAIAIAAEARIEEVRRTRCLRIAWFGMGDNPNFPVGLADLAAWAPELDRMRSRGFDLQLTILTNRRAMTASLLAGLRRLSIPWVLDVWSESGERELLSKSDVAFLPVNSQAFSIAKSHNRAVTALTAGAQVLSSGYPLYQTFDQWIYRDGLELVHDYLCGCPRLSARTAESLSVKLAELAHSGFESRALVSFLASFRPHVQFPRKLALIHGIESSGDVHKFARRLGIISVAGPLTKVQLNFDVRIELAPDGRGYVVYVATDRLKELAQDLRPLFTECQTILTTSYYAAAGNEVVQGLTPSAPTLMRRGGDIELTAAYSATMADSVSVVRALFPGCSFIVSEQNRHFPWLAPVAEFAP